MPPATSPAYRGEDFTPWLLETGIVLVEINQHAEEKKNMTRPEFKGWVICN